MIDVSLITVHSFAQRMLTSLSVDEIKIWYKLFKQKQSDFDQKILWIYIVSLFIYLDIFPDTKDKAKQNKKSNEQTNKKTNKKGSVSSVDPYFPVIP